MNVRRSCLSVPGSSEKMLAKVGGLRADEIVIDLEDSVTAGAKAEARDLVCRMLTEARPIPGLVAVRVNALDSPWGRADVAELVERAGSIIDSLVVPKVERAEDLQDIEQALDVLQVLCPLYLRHDQRASSRTTQEPTGTITGRSSS